MGEYGRQDRALKTYYLGFAKHTAFFIWVSRLPPQHSRFKQNDQLNKLDKRLGMTPNVRDFLLINTKNSRIKLTVRLWPIALDGN